MHSIKFDFKRALASILIATFFAFGVFGFANAQSELPKSTAQNTQLEMPAPLGKLGDAARPIKYRIDLTIDPDDIEFSGHTEITTQLRNSAKFLFLHGNEFYDVVAKAKIGEKSFDAKYTQIDESGVVRLDFETALPVGEINLSFDYKGKIGAKSIGLFRRKVEEQYYVYSQFQSIDARRAFPSFDEPGFKTPFDISITTKAGLVAVSNGAQISKTKVGDNEKHSFATTDPLPTYLTAFMVGPFTIKEGTIPPSPQRANPIPLRIIGTKPNAEKMDFALTETPKIVALLEDYFGTAYPYKKLDQIGAPDFPGAMENAGAILYVDDVLFLDKNPENYEMKNFGELVSHEISHQWFGNLVTPKWWDDIWLNESFANWMGYKISKAWKPELNSQNEAVGAAFSAMDTDSLSAGRPIRHEIDKSSEADQAFDEITYSKGGQVVAMIANYLGDEAFKKSARSHIAKHQNGGATTDDFFNSLAQSGQDPKVLVALKSFVDLQGVPLINLQRVNGGYIATQSRYSQIGTNPTSQTWTIPFCYRADGRKKCTLLDEKPYKIEHRSTNPIFPNYDGVGYYRFKVSKEDWEQYIPLSTSMTSGEALSLLDSIWAQFYSGEVELPILLKLAKTLVNHSDKDVALASGYALAQLRTAGIIPSTSRAEYNKLFNDIYMAKFQTIGTNLTKGGYGNEKPEIGELRAGLAQFLAIEAENQNLKNRISRLAQNTAESPGGELLIDLYPVALRIMFHASNDSGMVSVFNYFKEISDKDERELIGPFLNNGTTSGATYLLAQMGKAGLRNAEKLAILEGVVKDANTREIGLNWMLKNHSIFTVDSGVFGSDTISEFAEYFCSLEAAQKIEDTFRTKVRSANKGEINFNRSLESIRVCAAFKDQKSKQITEDLAKAVN